MLAELLGCLHHAHSEAGTALLRDMRCRASASALTREEHGLIRSVERPERVACLACVIVVVIVVIAIISAAVGFQVAPRKISPRFLACMQRVVELIFSRWRQRVGRSR